MFAGVGCGVLVALALLLWPAAAQAQTPPLRGPCQGAASPLTVSPSGGTATFTADASIQFTGSPSYVENCAVSTGPSTWNVQRTCTYHCQHWHTFLPTGVPLPAETTVTPSVPSGSYLLGWSPNCAPAYGQPRTSCTVKMNGAQTVVAAIGAAPDTSPPTAPAVTASKVESFAVTLSWTGAGDDHWVGGYDIYKNGQLAGRAGPGARSFRVTNGVFCQTNHTFRVEAFDTAECDSEPGDHGPDGHVPAGEAEHDHALRDSVEAGDEEPQDVPALGLEPLARHVPVQARPRRLAPLPAREVVSAPQGRPARVPRPGARLGRSRPVAGRVSLADHPVAPRRSRGGEGRRR